jgi:hypothetical protein
MSVDIRKQQFGPFLRRMRMFRNITELTANEYYPKPSSSEVTPLSLATRKECKLGVFHGEAIRKTPGPKREEVTTE